MGEVAIFNDEITKQGLIEIVEKSKTLPAVITNKEEFELIYSHYQSIKNIRIAINKKTKELIKLHKFTFETHKSFTQNEETKVLNILSPIETKLKTIREIWEKKQKIKAEEKAAEIAERQKAEFNRQEIIRVYDQAHIENQEYDQKIFEDLEREKKDAELKQREAALKELAESLDQRDKELELQEKERIEEVEENTAGPQISDIFPHHPIAGVSAKDAIENFNANTKAIFKESDEELSKQNILPSKPEDETEEFEFICPNCDFKFNVQEGV